MHWFLKLIILPLLDAFEPKVLVEIGVEVGAVTRPLLAWAHEHDAILHSVDPDPNLNVDELIAQYGERLRFHRTKSLDVLGQIGGVDLALIDGDHNWYTVINELRTLERSAAQAEHLPPIVALHDIDWPYGRRDLYYDPASIPEPHRQAYARMGILPGQSELGIGLNDHLDNALLENTPSNGVLTAVEDFVAQSESDWRIFSIPGLSGLAILATGSHLEHSPTSAVFERIDTPEFLRAQCEEIESARIQAELKRASLSRRMAEAQLRQVMQRVDPEELLSLKRRVRELEAERRESTHALRRAEESEEQLRLIEAGLLSIETEPAASTQVPSAETDGPEEPDSALGALHAARRLELSEARVELELANAQCERLRSALGRARADAEIAHAEREATERRLTEREALGGSPATERPLGATTAVKQSSPDPTPSEIPHASAGSGAAKGNGHPTKDDRSDASQLAAAENEREASAIFLKQFMPVAEAAFPDEAARDPLALAGPLDLSGLLVDRSNRHEREAPDGGQPSVDVIVCVHNALAELRICLWSLMGKTARPFGLIVVDDVSDTQTRQYLDALVAREPRVTLIRREHTPHGYTLAANAGLRASSADYLVLLNSDTVVSDGWLERLVSQGERSRRIGIVGPLSNAASHQSVPELRHDGSWSTNPLPSWLTVDGAALAAQVSATGTGTRLPFLNGFCYAIKRATIDAIGYLDEERFPDGYCEENDYSQRARDAGFELAVADDVYVFHAKSASFGTGERDRLAKRNYETFRAKHGPEQIDRIVAELDSDQSLAPVRAAFARATTEPAALVDALTADASALSVTFILPGLPHGGSGGSHSVYQEVSALRRLGVPAHIALPRWDMERAGAAYPDADEIFRPFANDEELACVTADADVISATHYKSVLLLRALRERRADFLPAYYVQDYEPFFTAPYIAEEAIASYEAIPDMLLFAKSHWLCNVVAERHGLFVAKVEPSLDEQLFRADGRAPRKGPKRIAAMIRPRTARRQPVATVSVLTRLLQEHPEDVELATFGCYADELREVAPEAEPIIERHLGLLTRREVADVLRSSDVFLDMSLYQAFGRTALEAMACGATAVVPNVGGVWEFVEHGHNALALDTLDSEGVVRELVALLSDAELLGRLQTNALASAARHSSARAAVSEYLLFARAFQTRFDGRAGGNTDCAAIAAPIDLSPAPMYE